MSSSTVNEVTFRWDETQQGLLVTTARDQKLLTGSNAAQLLDFLHSIEQKIYSAAQPIITGGVVVEAQPEPQPRQIASPRLFLPSKRQEDQP